MSDVFYFGCIRQSGHYMFNTYGQSVRGVGDMPWGLYGEDGRLPPQEGHRVEGEAMVHHRDGWTALSFWDRSVDERFGCNSNFFLRGTYNFAEAVALARTAFPEVWARFKFAVVPFKGDADFKEKADQILADHAAAEVRRAQIAQAERKQPMTTRQQTMQDVVDQLVQLQEEGKIDAFAFAIIQPDGVPIFGHANPSYSLLGALEQAKLAMGAKMLRNADDVPGFEPENMDH